MEATTPGLMWTNGPNEAFVGSTPPPTAMVAVPAGLHAQQTSGSGGGGAAALVLPNISLRNASTSQFAQWNVTFNNIVGVSNLTQVVAEGEPPTRDSIYRLDQSFSKDDVDALYAEALREYQAVDGGEVRAQKACCPCAVVAAVAEANDA